MRAASTAGTVQPKPTQSGKNARPERPKRASSGSQRNAMRAASPLSSNIDRQRNKSATCGKKPSTPSTPAHTPSSKKEASIGCTAKRAQHTASGARMQASSSAANPAFSRAPGLPNDRSSRAATSKNASGSPTAGRRTMRSIRSSRLSFRVETIAAAAAARGSNPPCGIGACRAAASRASMPSPRRAEIKTAGMPVVRVSAHRSIRTPRFSSSSAMFSASTIGRRSAASSAARCRLRSSAAASATCTITPPLRISASTAARSSALCGVSAYRPGRSTAV